MRVLHVQDNPADAALIRRVLAWQAPDAELESVASQAAAIERLGESRPFDLALVDLHLPDGSGLDLVAWIREQRLPVAAVVLADSRDREAAVAALSQGADDYLVKDASVPECLVGTLRDACRRFREARVGRSRSLRVLYAADRRSDADLTRRHLFHRSPDVWLTVVPDLRQALARLPTDTGMPAGHDFLLLDLDSRGLDALELVKTLRVGRGLDIPIVLLARPGDEDTAARAVDLGASEYLVKHPGYLQRLPAVIDKVWRQAELSREQTNLSAASKRVTLALASSPVVLYTRRLELDERPIAWVSDNLVRVLGYDAAEALGPDWWPSRLHPEDREGTLAWLAGLVPGGSSSRDYRFLDGHGQVRWIRDELTCASGGQDAIPEAAGAWRDITEIKVADDLRETRLAVLDALVHNRSLAEILKELTSRVEALCPDTRATVEILDAGTLSPDLFRPLGVRADWTLPLNDAAGEVLGYFHVRYGELCYPTRADRELIGDLVRMAGLAVGRDRAETRLRQAAALFESAREGVVITDLDARILTVNRAFTEMTGYTDAEVRGRNPSLLSSGRQDPAFYQAMWAAIETVGHWEGEIWNRRKNGELYPQILSVSVVYDRQGKPSQYVGVMTDLTQLRHSETRLEHLVLYDPLTRLPNRRLIQSRIEHALEQADRRGHRIAVLFVDLDRFKSVNDTLGHLVGDELLKAIARRISDRLREEDTLARLGGDEFLLLMEYLANPEDAAVVAQAVLRLLSEPFRLPSGHDVHLGASIGISLYPDDGGAATDLVRQADVAMYQAKAEGRSTYRFFTPALTRAAEERLALEAHLRQALANGEFVLHYQPQIETESGRLIGCEALVRWYAPGEGLVEPVRFIPLAEEIGLMVPLGDWVLRTACTQAKAWMDAGVPNLTMAVNLSARQLRQSDLVRRVAGILEQTGLPPDRLKLELTESVIAGQGEQAAALLEALKSLGLWLSIDDFGTGYSSLASLKRFPIDELKIDHGFVKRIPHDSDDTEIAAAIVAVARNLKLKLVAEGVETQEQLDFLSREGCDACQGYFFSGPVPPDAFERTVISRGRSAVRWNLR